MCDDHTLKLIATGSTTVAIEGYPAARVSDVGACSFTISEGSANVFIGGATGACEGIEIAPEVEAWLEWTHRIVGWIGGLCLMGPVYGLRVAIVSLIGGEIGSKVLGDIGQHYGGKWGGVAGSILGGIIGGGIPLRPGVRSFINRLEPAPGMNAVFPGGPPPMRLKPKLSLGEVDEYGTLKGKAGENLFDRDHQPSKGALKERAEQLKGERLSATERTRIENRAQATAIPRDVHKAGPTYGGKNTAALKTSDASDLAAATRRDADAMVQNGRRLDPNNAKVYEEAAEKMKQNSSDNAKIDDWLRGLLDEEQ